MFLGVEKRPRLTLGFVFVTIHLMRIETGDCLQVMATMPDNSVDSIVTDPPYGLSFMGKKWDYDVPSVKIWKECLRVLKPGGHLLSFAGTRTQHRMAVNIEDAGFDIRDMIAWVYGSGFPKSHNIGKAVDKLQGNERKKIKRVRVDGKKPGKVITGFGNGDPRWTDKGTSEWEGWGTALKPALEPITVARKPIEGTVANNVLKYGTGGINIDESRVESIQPRPKREVHELRDDVEYQGNSLAGRKDQSLKSSKAVGTTTQGRFPANFIHDGSEEVERLFPNTTKAGNRKPTKSDTGIWGNSKETNILHKIKGDDGGSASRFFYCAKASKSERNKGLEGFDNKHPTVKPISLMRYLVKLVTPPKGTVLDPFMGSGTTGIACVKEGFDFIGIEMEEDYVRIAKARIESIQPSLL